MIVTLDAEVESIELEVFAGLDEDNPLDAAAGVIELFLCFDVDLDGLVVRVSVSHLINNDSNTGYPISIKNLGKLLNCRMSHLFNYYYYPPYVSRDSHQTTRIL